MKTAAFAVALLLSGAAVAQTSQTTDDMSQANQPVATTHSTMQDMSMAGTGATVEPSNAHPERDARGHLVISAPAMVPAGWNGTVASAMGGPLESAANSDYPPCSATVTDNCVQTYERGRSSR